MKRKILLIISIFMFISIVFTGCMPGDEKYTEDNPAGFFWGIWHGWIAPISLIGGVFNKSIRIYEVNNTGWLYDFGFYMAIISGFGGLSLARKSSKY